MSAHAPNTVAVSSWRHDPAISTTAAPSGRSAERIPRPSQYIGKTWAIVWTQAGSTATFFVATASLFMVMWGGLSVASVVAATTPDPVVHLVVAIDGAVLLPLLVFGGLKLWRREPWG